MLIILQIWDNFYVVSLQVLTKKKALEGYIKIHSIHIPAYSRIFRHIYAYSGVIQAYSEPCVALAYSELWYIQNPGIIKTRGIFRTLVYPKHCTFRTRDIFRTLRYSEPEAYSEPCQTFTMGHFEKRLTAIIIFSSYNYFGNISFSCPLVHEISMIFLMQV